MPTQSANRTQAEVFYRRLGQMFLFIFAINSVFAILPLRLTDSLWQLTLVETLKNTAPLAVIGVALLCLIPFARIGRLDGSDYPLQRRIRGLAPFAALGFFLLVPLQIHANWVQLRQADVDSQKTLRAIERRINEFRNASSNEELQQLTRGLPAPLQPQPQRTLDSNRQLLLANFEPRLAAVRTQTSTRKRQVIEKRIKEVFSDSLICAAYGLGFLALRRIELHPMDLDRENPASKRVPAWTQLRRKWIKSRRARRGQRRTP
jgi:hypothetical protein